MNDTKMIFGVCTSILFTGVILSIVFYLAEKSSNSSTVLGPASNWAWLGIVFGVCYGLIVGSLSGAIIVGFHLSILKATFFGLLLNFFLWAAFYVYTGGGWNDSLTYDFYGSVLVGIANGVVISIINSWQNQSVG